MQNLFNSDAVTRDRESKADTIRTRLSPSLSRLLPVRLSLITTPNQQRTGVSVLTISIDLTNTLTFLAIDEARASRKELVVNAPYFVQVLSEIRSVLDDSE